MKLGVLEMSHVGGKIYILNGIEKGNVDRWHGSLLAFFLGGLGVALGLVGLVRCLW